MSDACSKPRCKAARFVFLILVRKASTGHNSHLAQWLHAAAALPSVLKQVHFTEERGWRPRWKDVRNGISV